jgi:hypothetical protein
LMMASIFFIKRPLLCARVAMNSVNMVSTARASFKLLPPSVDILGSLMMKT